MRVFLPYNPKLKLLARKLRNNSTLSEILLWNQLKQGKLLGYDFHRQQIIENYIVDFFCPDLMLVIEVDGGTHEAKIEKDELRQREIEKYGITFLRILDRDIRRDMDGIVTYIKQWIIDHPKEQTPRLQQAGRIPSKEGNGKGNHQEI